MRTLMNCLTAALLVLAANGLAHAADAAKLRVLIIDGQNNHDWRSTTPVMKKELEESGRFTVEVATTPQQKPGLPTEPRDDSEAEAVAYRAAIAKYADDMIAYKKTWEKFNPDLAKFDVVLSNYNGAAWSAAFRKSLKEAVESGKIGLVIVHAADNSFPEWGDYNQMIGLGWRGSDAGDRVILDDAGKMVRLPKKEGPGAGHGAYHPFQVIVRDTEHPITKGMPAEWMHAGDELYHGLRGPFENAHLLATAFSEKTKGGTGAHEPMMWTVAYGKGRVFHTPMGHDANSMRCVGFAAVVCRGTEWAATGAVTLPLPDKFPTATEVRTIK